MSCKNLDGETNENAPKKLPKSAKENRTKSGKRKPLTMNQICLMHSQKLDPIKFQRVAQIFYKTYRLGLTATLINEITKDYVKINMQVDKDGYMKIFCSKNSCELQCIRPVTCKDLFIKIIAKKLL